MRPAVFVAPFFAEATLRFLDAAASLEGGRLGLISQDPARKLPPGLAAKLAAYHRVRDGLDPAELTDAVREVAGTLGGRPRLIGALEQLQVPLAEVRRRLGLEGMGVEAARNFRDKSRMKELLRQAGR